MRIDAQGRLGRSGFLAFSLLLLALLWWVAAGLAQSRALPAPQSVAAFLVEEAIRGDLFFHLAMTLMRVVAAFVISMIVGTAIGIALGYWKKADLVFDPWVVIFLNIPALVVIVLAYIWFGLSEAAAIGAVAFTKIPNVVVTMREGARALDPSYAEMARVFRFGHARSFRHVVLPQLQPFVAAAARSGVSLIWKIVLVVELLGRPNGVGFQIYTFFQFFDVRAIMAYSLAFVAVMLAIEFFAVQPYERRATRWR